MPAVFVHGNPETAAVWEPLLTELDRGDAVALALPGFGVSAPDGFGATKDDYVDWLVGELASIGEPVDLVGHDWGGGFALRVASTRPDLLRSWVSDVAGLFDPAYVWHDLAQVWQTPGDGEQWVADSIATPVEERVELLVAFGITPAAATSFTEAFDDQMGRCMLALYRSAAQPALAAWAADVGAASSRPGLVVAPAEDPFTGGTDGSGQVAEWTGARLEVLDGLGHWWMLTDPARGARMLETFWADRG